MTRGGGIVVARLPVGSTSRRRAGAPTSDRSLCMVVHGPYPIGEPRVARQARAALEAGFGVDVHDLAPDLFASRFDGRRGGGLFDAALCRTERLAARLADAVVTVHEPYRQVLIARNVPASKVTVVMNSLDESLLPQAP